MNVLKLLLLFNFTAFLSVCNAQEYVSKTIQHDGLSREYSIYVPSSYDGSESYPLLFNFHGGDGLHTNWRTTADMRSIADTAHFILVYPQARRDPSDGNSRNWLPKSPGTFDDVPFVRVLIDTVANTYQVDQNRIYACGYSLGGEFSYELACKLNNRIAAIGAVARTMQADPNSYCSPVHPTGVLTILGTDDNISPYNGLTWAGVEYYISAESTHQYWAKQNQCDSIPSMSSVSSSVERYTWSNASGCAYVEELKVLDGGHDWPGSFGDMTIDASGEIWQFVSRFDIDGAIVCATSSIDQSYVMNQKYKVYPNPANSQITVEMSKAEDTEIRIYTSVGELVSSEKVNSYKNVIDISMLPPNAYFVKIDHQCIKIIITE